MARENRERLYWSVDEAAAHIGFSRWTLYRWARNATSSKPKKKGGQFEIPRPPCIRFGKYFRFPIEDFKRWATFTTEQRPD